jgi:hypothetical protein
MGARVTGAEDSVSFCCLEECVPLFGLDGRSASFWTEFWPKWASCLAAQHLTQGQWLAELTGLVQNN